MSSAPAGAAGPGGAAAGSGDFISRLSSSIQKLLARLLELWSTGGRLKLLTGAFVGLGVVFLAARVFHRRFLAKYRTNLRSTQCLPEYDYIVVGAGSAGAAVAGRLAEQDPKLKVLLLEAGDSDDVLQIKIPAAAIKLQRNPETDWCYLTEPQTHAHGNMEGARGCWPRGKVLGGCSSLNYMLFVRGAPQDFDSWAEAGAGPGWSYQSVLPYFKRLESVTAATSTVTPSALRGTDGPMPCNLIISPQDATKAFIEASVASGLTPLNPDYNAESIFGVAMSQYNVKGGRRFNTCSAYVAPTLQSHPNLHVLTHAHVQRVLFNDAKEAQGVALKRGIDPAQLRDQPESFIRAKREVILCAGAVGSPQLLELSGIGQAKLLSSLGIKVVADRPGVGENLQDHLAVPIFHESAVPTLSGADESLANVWRWLRNGEGPLTGNMVEAMSWFKTAAHSGAQIGDQMPDMQFHFLAGTIAPDDFRCFNSKSGNVDRFRKLIAGGLQYTNAIMPTLLHPRSRGSVHITSRSALMQPAIQPNYLVHPADVATFVEGCKAAMELYETQPALRRIAKRFLCDDMVPNNPYSRTAQADLYWEFYVRHQANTLYHPVGTCTIGSVDSASAVVDPNLRVIGVSRLRVADASVMPHLPSGNTNVPAIMVGEKCADLIKESREAKQAASSAAAAAAKAPSSPVKAKL